MPTRPAPSSDHDFEVLRSDFFQPGDVLSMGGLTRMEIVEDVNHADGVIYLGRMNAEGVRSGPGVIAVFFTYYLKHPTFDLVDHEATILAIEQMTADRCEELSRSVHREIRTISWTASLCFNPNVVFF